MSAVPNPAPEVVRAPELVGLPEPDLSDTTPSAGARPIQALVKRGIDIVVSVTLLVALAPLFLLLSLVVRLTSPGPAIYRQVRIGRHGQQIVVRKFRSMHVDADRERSGLLALNEVDGGHLFKMRRDPRITRPGHWLRKWSLDELPQLVNVLTGSMSLVGPRPALPDEVAGYAPEARQRLLVKPGLTGLWQVSGRSDLNWRQAVALDLHYVEHWSLWLDLRILARTIPAVLLARGAY